VIELHWQRWARGHRLSAERTAEVWATTGAKKRGHSHHHALRGLAAKWLKIIFVLWTRQIGYDETYHPATMARQQLRQTA